MFKKIWNGVVNFVKTAPGKVVATVAGVGTAIAEMLHPTAAHATADPIADMFTALNITSLSTNITTLLLAGVAIMVLFTGYRFLKRGARSL
jgi:membrane protein implicated in regulation of membrane protease activity